MLVLTPMQVYGLRLVAGDIWAAYRYDYRLIGDPVNEGSQAATARSSRLPSPMAIACRARVCLVVDLGWAWQRVTLTCGAAGGGRRCRWRQAS
jgi:hypothetical protein